MYCEDWKLTSKEDRVADMVRDVLLMTLLVVLNPFLLAIILLIVSRPRPVQNLFAYWVGCMITNLPIFLVPLVALHVIPSFANFAHDLAAPAPGVTLKPIQLGAGLVMLLVSGLVAMRHRKQQRTEILTPVSVGGDSAVLLLERPEEPTSDLRPPGRFDDLLARRAFDVFCINDAQTIDSPGRTQLVAEFLDNYFPTPSPYERSL